MPAQIIALCNQKGGVGKTTTTYHLARAAVAAGRRTVLIDADTQGNLSHAAIAEIERGQAGLADVLTDHSDHTIADVAVPGIWEGLTVVPSTGNNLAAVSKELVIAGPGRESRLRDALAPVRETADLILIDCAPSLDDVTINVLTAADLIAVVTEPSLFSTDGLGQLLPTLASVRHHYNPKLAIGGVIVNRYAPQERGVQAAMADLEEGTGAHGIPLLEPYIPKRTAIRDTLEAGAALDQASRTETRELAELYAAHLHHLEGASK